MLPDTLLFALVLGVVALGWWWRPWQGNSSPYPISTATVTLTIPTDTVTYSPTLAPTPTATSTRTLTSIPTPTSTAEPPATPTATQPPPTSAPSPTSTPTPSPTPTATSIPTQVHVVSKGETLSGVALQYGFDVEALRRANPDLNPRRLQIGQKLLIPAPGLGGAEECMPIPESRVITHTVQKGETLLGIAEEYGVTLNDIYTLNEGVSPQSLQIGRALKIELGPPTPTPTSTPLPTATPLPYPAPVLLGPMEGEEFQGPEAHILLWWASVGILGEDEWYVVRLSHKAEEIGTWQTKIPSWHMPSKLHSGPGGPPGRERVETSFQWDIIVKRADGTPISPPSASRSFFWR